MLDKRVDIKSSLELPFTAAHRAVGTRALRVHPLENTVQMKCVIACSPYERAIVARHFAVRAAAIKSHAAYSTCIIMCIPRP